ncbi:hypothetical protein NDU88_001606 [Pleurodeles waltl]|uniref:Uncharacterized protein n=1 Tax=Pleurodeles waltl TaxID=8319 RepID=A0AAV7VXA8_PLEWA|nr:hypothetical protein NDU88_001606 [Pleurodeles waltl]
MTRGVRRSPVKSKQRPRREAARLPAITPPVLAVFPQQRLCPLACVDQQLQESAGAGEDEAVFAAPCTESQCSTGRSLSTGEPQGGWRKSQHLTRGYVAQLGGPSLRAEEKANENKIGAD